MNAARDRINQLKGFIERERSQRMAAAVAENQDPAQQHPGKEELDALQEMARPAPPPGVGSTSATHPGTFGGQTESCRSG